MRTGKLLTPDEERRLIIETTRRLMDAQRCYNYLRSVEMELVIGKVRERAAGLNGPSGLDALNREAILRLIREQIEVYRRLLTPPMGFTQGHLPAAMLAPY